MGYDVLDRPWAKADIDLLSEDGRDYDDRLLQQLLGRRLTSKHRNRANRQQTQ